MSEKLVSIIIPLYNTEKYIAKTLESAISQSYENIEIIVVDDGSSDGGAEICRQYQQSDKRVRLIQQANKGLPGARNTGIRNSNGDYIAFLDADDIWSPVKVEKHVSHLEKSLDVGISFSYSAFIDEDGECVGLFQKPRKLSGITPAYSICRNPVGNGSAAFIRRQVFLDIEFEDNLYGIPEKYYFDERLRFQKADATDIECWTRMISQTDWKMEGIPEVLTFYRINSGGLSANGPIQLQALEAGLEKLCNLYPEQLMDSKKLAMAYYKRYIARRAVVSRDKQLAVKMANEFLTSDFRIVLQEPQRSLITFLAAYILLISPKSFFDILEGLGTKLAKS